jgi:hypothetical protein
MVRERAPLNFQFSPEVIIQWMNSCIPKEEEEEPFDSQISGALSGLN